MAANETPESKKEPGEFTRMFRAAAEPTPEPAAESDPKEEQKREGPGEFTRMFSAVAPPGAKLTEKPPGEGGAPKAAAPDLKEKPGEFTRGLTKAPQPQRPERPANAPIPPGRAAPSEFTRAFNVQGNAPAKAPGAPPPATNAPSEFTAAFKNPLPAGGREVNWKEVEKQPAPPASTPESGDFTKYFNKAPARETQRTPTPPAERPDDLRRPLKPGANPATAFVTEIDDFAAIVAGSSSREARVEAAAPAIPVPAPAAPPKPGASLPVLLLIIGLVLLLALVTAYIFVFRN